MFLKESVDTMELEENCQVESTEAGMFAIVLESSNEIHNLSMCMINCEHASWVKQDRVLLETGIKEFFTRIAEMLKKAWAKVKAWFVGIYEKIRNWFMGAGKFIAKYKEELSAITDADLKGAVVNVYTTKVGEGFGKIAGVQKALSDSGALADKADKSPEKITSDTIKKVILKGFGAKNGEDITTSVKNYIHGAKKSDIKIKAADIAGAVNVLENGDKGIASLKGLQKSIDGIYETAIATATKGASASDKEKESANKVVNALKLVADSANICISASISGINDLMSDALKIVKTAISAKHKSAGDKKTVKKESTSILEDFQI